MFVAVHCSFYLFIVDLVALKFHARVITVEYNAFQYLIWFLEHGDIIIWL